MEEFKVFNSVIENTVRNTSYITVIISSVVFISYTVIIKLIDYFRHKDDKKSLVEMGLAVKEVSNNVAKLNAILDNLFQDITKKNLEKGKIIIELAFFNFQYKIVNLCRNIIINNNIDINIDKPGYPYVPINPTKHLAPTYLSPWKIRKGKRFKPQQ